MKDNQNVSIVGSKVILVPYRSYHVTKYHEWMSDLEIRKLTASEPLTLAEEFQMQEKWAEDNDKCTFIVLRKQDHYENFLDNMIGDVNLFFEIDPSSGLRSSNAELEVMIADQNSRRKGFGLESSVLMMMYGVKHLNVKRYSVKIGCENEASLKMFQKLGFVHESYSEVFKEFTLIMDVEHNQLEKFQHLCDYKETYFGH